MDTQRYYLVHLPTGQWQISHQTNTNGEWIDDSIVDLYDTPFGIDFTTYSPLCSDPQPDWPVELGGLAQNG